MANWSGTKAYPIERLGSLVDWDDSTVIPIGVASVVKNCKFKPESVGMRDGLTTTMQVGSEATGLTCLNYNADQYIEIPLVFDISGNLKKESPAGSGTMVPVTSTQISLPSNKHMVSAQAFNREYMAFSDLESANGINAVYDAKSGKLDQLSGLPVGTPWESGKAHIVGEVVSPSTANGHLYRCSVAGTSGISEPTWPLTDGGTIADNGITWTENTPKFGIVAEIPTALTRNFATIPGYTDSLTGRDVYVRCTFKNSRGETTMSPALLSSPVVTKKLSVNAPLLPSWLSAFAAEFTVGIYECDVVSGGAVPADGAYKLASYVACGAILEITTAATGAVAPTVNNCLLSDLDGNICAGKRNAVVFFKNRNGSSSWAAEPCIIEADIPSFGYRIWMGNIPIGPDNTIARQIAFNVANGGSAGNYFIIPNDDSPDGLLQTSTVINDNTTTGAYFTFTDPYLADLAGTATDVTDFTLKIQIPPAKAICYSRSLRKMIYVAPKGYETGFLISFTDDAESTTGDVSFLAPGDTQDVPVGWVELRGDQYALKSNSGHYVNPTIDSPSAWPTAEKWSGSGPCGPMAYDKATGSGDDGEQFVIYAHRTAPYRWTGTDPVPINVEIPNLWKRINWAYEHLIWTKIDEESKEVRFGVPLDGATKPNKVITVNYSAGWTEPLRFSVVATSQGGWTAVPVSRKWSVDDIAANCAIAANRTLPTPPNSQIATRQLLYAGQDGNIRMAVPDSKNDDGAAIDQQYKPAYAKERDSAVIGFDGVTVKSSGVGDIYLSPQTEKGSAGPTKQRSFTSSQTEIFDVQFRGEGENFGILVTNGYTPEGGSAQADTGFELNNLILRGHRKWSSRRG